MLTMFFLLHRKCKLTTTGPWQEVSPIALSDVSILPCGAQSSVDMVPLWAISNKGDVLCRLGVSSLTPAVSRFHCYADVPKCRTCRPLLALCQTGCGIFILSINRDFSNIVVAWRFPSRALPGSMWEPTSLSSRSPSGLPARFGPLPEMVLPFIGVLSALRTQQVSGSKSAIGHVRDNTR